MSFSKAFLLIMHLYNFSFVKRNVNMVLSSTFYSPPPQKRHLLCPVKAFLSHLEQQFTTTPTEGPLFNNKDSSSVITNFQFIDYLSCGLINSEVGSQNSELCRGFIVFCFYLQCIWTTKWEKTWPPPCLSFVSHKLVS